MLWACLYCQVFFPREPIKTEITCYYEHHLLKQELLLLLLKGEGFVQFTNTIVLKKCYKKLISSPTIRISCFLLNQYGFEWESNSHIFLRMLYFCFIIAAMCYLNLFRGINMVLLQENVLIHTVHMAASSSHSSICNVLLMEHMECFLSSLPQTLALIRAVEVSLSGHSPTADFSCFSRSFLQGKLQNLATLQKVLRHRKKHSGQLWLWGLCLVLHMSLLASHIWKCYVKQSIMSHSDSIWNWKPLTNMVI